MSVLVRSAKRNDCALLLGFMRGLAEFEGYIDVFRVTKAALETRGFPQTGEPEFYALLAELNGKNVGMLVYYFIPFTFDLRPTLFIKELFVDPIARNNGVGEALFNAAIAKAKVQDCGRIKWDVLHNNEAAKRFYHRQGAHHDKKWQGFILDIN